jgi:chlorobactene glucosyltransferase
MSSIEIILLIAYFPLLIMFLTSLINSLFGPMLRKGYETEHYPKVSVLIPARNEEKNIRNCLESIACNSYPDFEVIVIDDNSEDNTLRIIKECARKFPIISFMEGKPLPENWTGKTWACHQLSEVAKGEILVFTDADNTYNYRAITNTIAYMSKFNLDFISAFPEQRTQSFAEKLVIPMIDLIAYSFFILWSSLYVKFPIFIEANGQWLAVRKKTYTELGGHSTVKDKIVEDTELGRLFKKNRKRTLTAAGTGIVFGRMYDGFAGIWQGLSKNLFGIAGYNSALFFLLILILAFSTLSPYVLIFFSDICYVIFSALIINIIWRMLLSWKFHGSTFLISTILHPISIIIFIGIALNSYIRSIKGNIEWKGRKIDPGIKK